MVCKRSLYCWKNGPCASDQTRKQIWEDNIRFRESLRDINQSDHYWSFQISKNRCLCLEEEDAFKERSLSRRYRSASLHNIDCTSITHDCNGLKSRNCYVHCPDVSRHPEIQQPTPTPIKDTSLSCMKYPLYKYDEDKIKNCHRYKNTLSSSRLKPSMKTRFISQSNLSTLKNLPEKKTLHTSCENVQSESQQKKKEELQIKTTNSQVQTDLKLNKKLNPVKFPHQGHEYSPISRTTRKMLLENKKIPFATYGCNNSSLDIGLKRTHNVLASKLEVYPNAISAKQQKRDLIMKYIQSEKEFQKKCLPEELQKKINHSSLWSLDAHKKETKSLQKKNTKYLLPMMNKPLKKVNLPSTQVDFGHYRTYRKPQVYFY